MKIGVIGIGVMGEPMARNLHKAGHSVTVYNRTASRCDGLHALGIVVAETARQAIEASDAIVLMVPSHVEVDEALGLMTKRRIRHLPVMENDTMCGFISIGDLVKSRFDEVQDEARALRSYIQTA